MTRPTEARLAVVGALIACVIGPAASNAAPGDLDETFAGDGIASVPATVQAVAIQPDRTVVVAGMHDEAERRSVRIVRYTPTGVIDGAFGEGGIATPFEPVPFSPVASDLIAAPGGFTYVGTSGRSSDGSAQSLVARLQPDGRLDPSYGAGGVASLPAQIGALHSIALDGGERIVVGAPSAVVRLLPDGSLDRSFSEDGIQELEAIEAARLALTGAGSIVSVGALIERGPEGENFGLTRLLPNGEPDESIGQDGTARFPVYGVFTLSPRSIAVDSAGRALIGLSGCGSTLGPGAGFACNTLIVRLTAFGQQDEAFGARGSRGATGSTVAVDAQDRPLVAGSAYPASRFPTAGSIARLNADGTADPEFGLNGQAYGYNRLEGQRLSDIAIGPDGTIVAAGGDQVLRIETGAGPRDLDADGILDRDDRCKLLHAGGRRGCPRVPRSVVVYPAGPSAFKVKVNAAVPGCEAGQRVETRRVEPGKDAVVSVDRTNRIGQAVRVRAFQEGRYYAIVSPDFKGRFGFCRRAVAESVALRQLANRDQAPPR